MPTFFGQAAHAQSLDVQIDTRLGTGVTTAGGAGARTSQRTPTFLGVDLGFVLDRDFDLEWGLGLKAQVEDTIAAAVTPQLRVLRDAGPVRIYAGAGVPFFVTPFRRFGGEITAGALWPIGERLALIGGVAVDIYFAGGDIPDGVTTLELNFGLGGRAQF